MPLPSTQCSIAPLWRRLAALVYDAFLVFALWVLAGFINLGIQITRYGESHLRQLTDNGQTLDNSGFYFALMGLTFSFFVYCWCQKGQTLGMKAWRIRIVTECGGPITLKQATIRWLTAIPAIAFFLLGTLWMLIDPQKKSWQDHASKTVVVLLPS